MFDFLKDLGSVQNNPLMSVGMGLAGLQGDSNPYAAIMPMLQQPAQDVMPAVSTGKPQFEQVPAGGFSTPQPMGAMRQNWDVEGAPNPALLSMLMGGGQSLFF